jgi:hypothetical protein
VKKLLVHVLSVLALMLAFTATAFAAGTATGDEQSLLDLAKPVIDAVITGNPGLAAALALVFVAAAARRYGGKRIAFLNTDAGGALIVLVGAFGGAAATALTGGATWSLALAWMAFKMAAATAGGYSLIKRLLVDPFLRPYVIAKMPQWLRVPVELGLAWLFSKPDPIAEAVAAGKRAVAENPSKGLEGSVGEIEELK